MRTMGNPFLPAVWSIIALSCWLQGMVLAGAELPEIWQQPVSQRVPMGVNAQFEVQAGLTTSAAYQWYENEKPLTGETNAFLNLFCASLAQSNASYQVVLTNVAGAVTSSPAVLEVFMPEVGRVPQVWGENTAVYNDKFSATHYRGQNNRVLLVDVVGAAGSLWGTGVYTDDSSVAAAAVHAGWLALGERGTVALQILPGESAYNGTTAHGVTSASWGDYAGSYQFIGTAPTITRHPIPQVRMIGAEVTFAVEALGTGLTYQWFHNGNPLPGETNPAVRFKVMAVFQAGSYAVTVSGPGMGYASTSEAAILGVLPPTVGLPQETASYMTSFPVGTVRRLIVTGSTNSETRFWGSGIYTADSSLARAAVHDGWLAPEEEGVIAVVRLPDMPEFVGITRNQVTSIPFEQCPAMAILGKVPMVRENPLSQAILPGGAGQLRVKASYTSDYAMQWMKDGQFLADATNADLTVTAGMAGTSNRYEVLLFAPGLYNVSRPAWVFYVPPDAPAVTATSGSEFAAMAGNPGQLIHVSLTGITGSRIWGTGLYTWDSNPALAAVHAGWLAAGQSATVSAYTIGLWPEFREAVRNGVASEAYGTSSAYVFVIPDNPLPEVRLAILRPSELSIENAANHICQVWFRQNLSTASWTLMDALTVTNSPQVWRNTNAAQTTEGYYRVVVLP